MPLRVGMDVSALALTRAGTARHIRSLLEALRDEDVDVHRYALGGSARALVPVRDLAWYLTGLPWKARRDGVNVLHCPTQRAPTRSRVPLVVTFHDLAVLRHPETFNRWTRTYSRGVLPGVVRAATRLIAVSEFTKRELVELLDAPAEKVRVIPNAVGAPFTSDGDAAAGDYVLAVSTLEPRKNLERLVDGYRRAELDGLPLLVAGAAGWGGVRVQGDGVRWLGEVRDDELARLYRGARAVAYVSLYEGFGLPVLEAMACGAPVVASRNDALEEVAGNAAVLVDPLDPAAIAAGLQEAIDRREELRSRGLARARAFDWHRVARETVAVYREAVSHMP
ncbi:MAG TPA: glycosyltransferase family 1 protein [Gaiellaceae bacterium]|nr:glycosyltransferase family 1 protein [Gaiellaceae bacterium]